MTSIVVYEVLSEIYQLEPDIKWSNDVLINEKKISGILAETVETNKGLAVIVGVGINLDSKNFPPELSRSATSIKQETDQTLDLDELLNSLTQFFQYFYDIFRGVSGAKIIRDEWQKRSSYFQGKNVRVKLENRTIKGITRGLEENGALKIIDEFGKLHIIQAGDVEVLRKA